MFQALKNFQENRRKKKIERCARVIRKAKAVNEDRWAAIDFFASLDDIDAAVPNLLARFDFSIENGIKDTREKEACMEAILKRENAALPHVSEHLMATTRIAWPIKIIKQLGNDNTLVKALFDALNFDDVTFDADKINKNYDILTYMVDFQLGNDIDKLKHFLTDKDERVRYAAAEVMLEQQDNNSVPELLEPFLADETSENIRIHEAVVTAFSDRKWKVKDPSKYPEGVVAKGVRVKSDGSIQPGA